MTDSIKISIKVSFCCEMMLQISLKKKTKIKKNEAAFDFHVIAFWRGRFQQYVSHPKSS